MVNRLEPKDRDISMVFQSYGLYPNLSVYENIRFPLRVRKVPKDQHHERVMKAAEMVELTDLLDRRPAALSGGQRQRVALGRAIVRRPNVFLMDEPLSNLDAKLRVSTRAQIKNLQSRLQTTTVYVTHDQIEAMTLADRVVVMNKGVIQQVGTPTEIYDRPANTFVAGFIGSPADEPGRGDDHGRRVRGAGHPGRRACRPGTSGAVVLGFRAEDAEIAETGELSRAGLLDRAAGRSLDDLVPHGRGAGFGEGAEGLPRRHRRDRRDTYPRRPVPPLRRRHGPASAARRTDGTKGDFR